MLLQAVVAVVINILVEGCGPWVEDAFEGHPLRWTLACKNGALM